ncbi:hypothetical protein LX32DRAFT_9299 [Colletotrichum zoysiae]|uniref:Uncharacterized protein n=1 Tax=Colletotrichum zoysiae TaxID=1216348 RepID=A0AAD9LZL6_9PEZI|nr:hypothetical protein LX32DRAFT_9299 [Colletotrichum zoysiae]
MFAQSRASSNLRVGRPGRLSHIRSKSRCSLPPSPVQALLYSSFILAAFLLASLPCVRSPPSPTSAAATAVHPVLSQPNPPLPSHPSPLARPQQQQTRAPRARRTDRPASPHVTYHYRVP